MMGKPLKSTEKHPGADDEPPKSPIWRATHMQQAQELAPWCLTAEPPYGSKKTVALSGSFLLKKEHIKSELLKLYNLEFIEV